MTDPRLLSIKDFTYHLPEERISAFPLEERDASRLLVYRQGQIGETVFRQLDEQLPPGTLLVFNDSRVVHARLLFQTAAGQQVEVFCLEPVQPVAELQAAMQQTGSCVWKCLIGNNRRWKSGLLTKELQIEGESCRLQVERLEAGPDYFFVRFSWEPAALPFAAVLEAAGQLPLPPYFKRAPELTDEGRYQTVYARHEGSVAAPTAGLHFTPRVLQKLEAKNIDCEYLTLHVGAGTFRPVKAEQMARHEMHAEQINVSRHLLEELHQRLLHPEAGPVVAVGTTSMRTLESLYWFGKSLRQRPEQEHLWVAQWEPYENPEADCTPAEAIAAILEMLQRTGQPQLTGRTSIIISPGYRFRICDGLITNFHQPESTLLLLVSAFIGDDWRQVYGYALEQGFRFLSYGDSSLLWRSAGLL